MLAKRAWIFSDDAVVILCRGFVCSAGGAWGQCVVVVAGVWLYIGVAACSGGGCCWVLLKV